MIGMLIRSVISYFLLLLVIVFIGIPCLLLMLIPARWRYDSKLFFKLSHIFYWTALKTSLVPINFVGKENIPKEPAIIVANHQSSMDIPLVGVLLDAFPHVWLAKSELARSWLAPIVRRMAVLIDMSTPQRGVKSLMQAINLIKGKKRHAIIFPEGGRYIEDNGVREFFAGFVMLAKQTNRPVVPIMIFNAYKVYPPGSFFVYRYPIKVLVGKPFHYKDGQDMDQFKQQVYSWFVKQAKMSES